MTDITLKITGMSCERCVAHVAEALRELPGVASADVSLANGEARVQFDPLKSTLAEMKEAVEEAGYEIAD